MRPLGLKPALNLDALRGAEAPLFHGAHAFVGFSASSKVVSFPNRFMSVHPTAVIDPRAKVAASCQVGAYCVIGAEVELGENCRLISHVAIEGPTKIGADNSFFPFCAIGMAPQDVSYKGEATRLEIGER